MNKIADSEIEKKARLKMLHEIGMELKVERGLADVFQKVVELTHNRLNSEEAALFILDEETKGLMRKVATKGPSIEATNRLIYVETQYAIGESLAGRIFLTKEPMLLNMAHSEVEYLDSYLNILPSTKVRHYLGVPLIIGEEIHGVLRVINRRGPNYSVENSNFELSENGFDEEDVELLQIIASQVASAIRSAEFIELQRQYREVVENSPDPIIVLDETGRVKVFNKACEKVWGFSASEVMGNQVASYYESESHANEIGKLLRESQGHRVQDYPARIKNKYGGIIPISLSASILFDGQGNEIGSVGVFKDLRETLKLQEEKTNAEKLAALGKLAHTVGHDIKHDIATALNYINTLAYECADGELTEIYRDIQESLREALDKFQNMLLVGRTEPPKKRLVAVEDIFNEVETSLRRRADSRRIEFSISYPEGDNELQADLAQLRQALSNLFDNSIDAITAKNFEGEKGRIELSAQVGGGVLRVTWRDNGCGIPQHSLPKLFTPFVTSKPTGTGLGLFIIKNIIDNHGGRISVESEEGEGTSFKITLPLYAEDA